MTEEKKQALIEEGNRILKHGYGTKKSDELIKIALAALTVQPVKLPQIIQIGYTHDEITAMCNVRNDAVAAIRAAGYQVEGE